ncbi:dynein heavy chain 2, axonemal-like [Nylanderia fulva]|uniref:dynein heavy chain 2, axonemal-like n=1 Tax=Nylanderia fulva TaxID=613905 RepID=UPI0010FB596E|nr:dynein heavy chain 2, axonemal-like [Nylanderia fulva]
MQRRRNKVKDKPPPDPRREYLDAESSDEAERRGEDEGDEEDELRPIYGMDEINKLIQCIKDMTTLSGLTDGDWTWKCDRDIREFFHDPSIPVLCVYHVNGDLTTEFSFPTVPVHELTYFVRQPNEILYPENFRERILFGSLNDKVEDHTLNVIQNVFAPIFFTIETWPDSILLCATSPYLLLHFRQTTQLIRATNAKSFASSTEAERREFAEPKDV